MRLETLAAGLLLLLISPPAAAQQTADRPGHIVGDDSQALSCQASDPPGQTVTDDIQPLFSGRGSSLVHCVGGPAANVHNLGFVMANVQVCRHRP